MKFKINGVSDKKIILALKKLTNSFFHENSFVETEADYEVTFEICEDQIKLMTEHINLEKAIFNQTLEENNLKYTILAVYYQFLHVITNKSLPWGVLTGIRPTKLAHKYLSSYSKEKTLEILQKKYLLSDEKANLMIEIADLQKTVLPDFDTLANSISLYVNIPFCVTRCTYCSFTAYNLDYRFVSIDEYLDKLFEEITFVAEFIRLNEIKISTIYIGGGTPTALNNEQLKSLLVKIENEFNLEGCFEYTLECGRPDTLSRAKLEIIKDSKVTRISINPQTFSQATLDRVNRHHKVEEIIDIFHLARSLDINNINMDLIMGLPNEKINDAVHSVEEVLKLSPESITVHTLAYKKGANLNPELSNDDLEVEKMYNYSFNEITRNGYKPYYLYRQKNIVGNLENIGFTKEGFASPYNIIMIEELQNIIGLGCGASSKYLNHEIVLNPKDLISYVKSYKEYLNKKLNLLKENLVKIEDMLDE